MPLYEYTCTSCTHRFEVLAKVDAPAPPCETCGAGTRRLVSAVSFQLNGGGWYKDGYAAPQPTPQPTVTKSR